MLFKCSLYDPLKSDFGNFTSVDKFDTFAKVISCAKKSVRIHLVLSSILNIRNKTLQMG